jgi:glucose-1-phosphate thymidylyltransferase
MKKQKGVILAGGTGSRLYPLTKTTNKSLLPIGAKPMINHCLDLFVSSGVTDILIITGPEHCGQIMNQLGSGSDINCSLTYKIQDKPNGIAAALKLAKDFVGCDKFTVILGDNIFSDHTEISKEIIDFNLSHDKFKLFTKKVKDPERFGVAVYKNGYVIDIVEKPTKAPSKNAIIGIYCYSPDVFNIIDNLSLSNRNEYEISDVNSTLVKNLILDRDKKDFYDYG